VSEKEKKEAAPSPAKAALKSTSPRTCRVKGCKRPYRAKGYCNAHFHKWRKGELPHGRYKTCQHNAKKLKRGEKKECMKKVFRAGLCEEHYKARRGAAAAPAAPAAPAEGGAKA